MKMLPVEGFAELWVGPKRDVRIDFEVEQDETRDATWGGWCRVYRTATLRVPSRYVDYALPDIDVWVKNHGYAPETRRLVHHYDNRWVFILYSAPTTEEYGVDKQFSI